MPDDYSDEGGYKKAYFEFTMRMTGTELEFIINSPWHNGEGKFFGITNL